MTDAELEQAEAPLEDVIADAREHAAVLRSHGHGNQAKSIEDLADRVSTTMRSYFKWMSESEARLRSGWTVERLKREFPRWEASGFAKLDERDRRRYRECIVPARADKSAAHLAGARGEPLRRRGQKA